ncbi:STAS domain-containing protein [Amycolatopsis balhimycina]|uniref:STAS domain-containing protein n=1 Tax=Amycolatopsis balhimycina TaxID=208443 RepID=UPI000370BC6A|nr:STAS domain-containing protein [Amycolatopsis balhimycina]
MQVIGDVDLSTRDIWQRALEAATANAAPALLDLSHLTFIDARGAAMLVDAARHQPDTAPLTLTRPPAILSRMLTLLYRPRQ